MDKSVLIIGDDKFSEHIHKYVPEVVGLSLQQVHDRHQAEQLMTSEMPGILLLQSTQQDTWELCRLLRRAGRLTESYCILIDDRPCPLENSSTETLLRYTGLTSTALEAGADAYIWIPEEMGSVDQTALAYLSRLIQAQIKAAAYRLKAYQELSETNDLLSAIALIDPLTQLGNRRALDWELPRQVETAHDARYPLSLLILDIDHFKQINDLHGHLVGDQVLQMFAHRLRQNMRFHETPFRYGGEEFVVLLKTSLQEAERTAERLRRFINDDPFIITSDLVLPLTVSIGVARLEPRDDAAGGELLARADSNLMRAKRTGRNRVIIG